MKRRKEASKFIPSVTGRLETTYEKLKQDFGNRLSGRIYDVDISEHTKEFSGSLRVPAKIQEAVRRVLDDYLKEGNEFYFQVDEKVFGVFFGQASKAVAELKVQVIRNELGRTIDELKKKKQTNGSQENGRATRADAPPPANQTEKRGTLSRNPDEKEMKDWASRAMLNMATKYGFEDFRADVQLLSEIIKVQYKPLWYFPNRLVSGYVVETTAPLSNVEYAEKQSQEDLAILAAATRHMKAMAQRGEHALFIVPVLIDTICGKNTRDLFNIYCRSIEPELKRFIVLRIKGMDIEAMSRSDWEALKALTFHSRSMIIDAPHKKIDPKKLVHLNFHAFGFDISHLRLPEEQLFKVVDDFAGFYQKYGKDTFILGIPSLSLLSAALASGYTYVSGPAVMPYRDMASHAQFMRLKDVYERRISLLRGNTG